MIAINEINLEPLGVRFPAGGVAMVLAQPFLDLQLTPPFACEAASRERLLACVDATLEIARRRPHGEDKTHFTVFPEYTIPGLEGIAKIDSAMAGAAWPSGTVVLGGIEGMTPAQFRKLVEQGDVSFDSQANGLERLLDQHWVNCSVTWVKTDSGVKKWVQPKISPAWPERAVQSNGMYGGKSIYLFKGKFENGATYRFHSLLCFDWVGDTGGKRVWEWVHASMDSAAQQVGASFELTWVFLMQCNDAPSHASFMAQVQNFFDQNRYASASRERACLVMANVAGKDSPGRVREFGTSAVIHAPQQFARSGCVPTFSDGGPLYRAGDPLVNFGDAVFRESGACIHSFVKGDSRHAAPGVAGRQTALRNATVHPFAGMDCPRTAGMVPAAIKWLHDELDDDHTLSTKHPTFALADESKPTSSGTTDAVRRLQIAEAEHSVRLAAVGNAQSADKWSSIESAAVDHLHQTLSIVNLAGYASEIHGKLAHATVGGGEPFDVVAVRGHSHEATDRHVTDSNIHSKVPLLIVSRDDENTEWDREERTIFDDPERKLEVSITDPGGATRRVSYQTVLKAYRQSKTVEELRGKLDAVFN